MKARKSDLVALGVLVAALVLFLLSLFLVNERWYEPVDPFMAGVPGAIGEWREYRGYESWVLIYELIEAGILDDFLRGMAAAALLGAAVVMVAPFCVGLLTRSRPLWWLVVSCSGVSLAAYVGGLVWLRIQGNWEVFEYELCAGHYFDAAYHVLNFIGLLCVRKCSVEPDGRSRPVGTE